MVFNPRDYYNKEAKKKGFKARSVFKLEQIDTKFRIFWKNPWNILDLGCSPGSWIQYAMWKKPVGIWKILGFDIKPVTHISRSDVFTYVHDITDIPWISALIDGHGIKKFDIIMCDAAPNTMWIKDIDAMRSVLLIQETVALYQKYLVDDGKFVIKVFMWPWFDDLVADLKWLFGGKHLHVYKPDASRKQSKEVFIVKNLR